MSRRTLGSQTITRLRAELVKDPIDNTWYRDWDNVDSVDINGCSVQPVRLSDQLRFEDIHEREFQNTFLKVYAPPTADIEYTDEAIYNGKRYNIRGEATDWIDLNGRHHHTSLLLELREG